MNLRLASIGVALCAASLAFTACDETATAAAETSSQSEGTIVDGSSNSLGCSSASNGGSETLSPTERCTYTVGDESASVTLRDFQMYTDILTTTRIDFANGSMNMTFEVAAQTQSQAMKRIFCQSMMEEGVMTATASCNDGRFVASLATAELDPSMSMDVVKSMYEQQFKATCDSANSIPETLPQTAYKVTGCEVKDMGSAGLVSVITGDGWKMTSTATLADASGKYVTEVEVFEGFDAAVVARSCENEKLDEESTVTCAENQISITSSTDDISLEDMQDVYANALCPALLSGKMTLEDIIFDNEE